MTKLTKTDIKKVNSEFLRWRKMLKSYDPIAVFLRGHLIVESMLSDLIEYDFTNPEYILDRKRQFTFFHKYFIVCARNLITNKNLRKCIFLLDEIRNALAHNVDVNPDEIEKVHELLDIDLSLNEIGEDALKDLKLVFELDDSPLTKIKHKLLCVISLLSKDRERAMIPKIRQRAFITALKNKRRLL